MRLNDRVVTNDLPANSARGVMPRFPECCWVDARLFLLPAPRSPLEESLKQNHGRKRKTYQQRDVAFWGSAIGLR
jgi:hypothetical protein